MDMLNPHAGTGSTAEIEALNRSRRRMLIAVLVTSTLWIVPQILTGALDARIPRILSIALILAGVVAGLAWMIFMLRYHRFQMRVLADPAIRQRLDDERVIELRKESVYRGWVALVIAIAIGVAVAPFADLPDQVVLLTLMLIGVNAPILFFLVLDRG